VNTEQKPPKTYTLTMVFTLEEVRQLLDLMGAMDDVQDKELISEFKLAIQKNSILTRDLAGF
jgi:hypothetical protein